MGIRILKAATEDVAVLLEMMTEFAAFEGLSGSLETTAERLQNALFAKNAFVAALIAWVDENAAAYAMFYPSFSTFRGQQGLFLEDLFVREAYRGTGVGDLLLRAVAREARTRGFERLDFLVLDWNSSAIDFYEKRGAVRDDVERHFKFVDQAFMKLSE